MADYSFSDKNSSCVLILSADSDEEAEQLLKEKLKYPYWWRMEVLDDDSG